LARRGFVGAVVDQVEVDVLERRAHDLERVELAPGRCGSTGELGQHPGRLVGVDHDVAAVLAVADLDVWRDAWDVIQAFPLSGTGLNTFGDSMLFYQERNAGFHMAQAHNDYVQLAAEGGLLVVVPAVVAAVLLARAIAANLRAARPESRGFWIRAGAAIGLAAIAIQEVAEFSLQIPVNALLFATLVSVALAPVAPRTPSARDARDTIDFP